jgi:hypothetical protein
MSNCVQNIKIDLDTTCKNDQILYGISVKARSVTSGYLDGADFSNPLIEEYKHYLKPKSIKTGRIVVPTFLQDMARIENLNSAQVQRFYSMTIVYDSLNSKHIEWVRTFDDRFNHKYIFLLDEKSSTLKSVFEREIDNMINR